MSAPLLDDFTLARFRALQEGNMLSVADLYVFAPSRAPGAVTTKLPVLVASVKCRVSALGSSLPIIAAQPTPLVTYILTVPATTNITGVERVILHGTTDGIAWTAELIITGADEPRTFSASKRLNARLAPDSLLPTPTVGTVTVTYEQGGVILDTLPSITGLIHVAVLEGVMLSGVVPSLTGALHAFGPASGDLAGTLPSLTGALTATADRVLVLAGTLPSLTGAIAVGTENRATITATLPSLSGALALDVADRATITATLPSLTGALTGTVTSTLDFVTADFVTADFH